VQRDGLRVTIRMHDKVRALEMLAKHLGLLTQRQIDRTGSADLMAKLALLDAGRERSRSERRPEHRSRTLEGIS
jgi:hypothetical protein